VLPIGQHHATDRDLIQLSDGFADDRESVVADFPVRHQVIGTDQIPRVDLAAVDELVDLDGSRRFQRDVPRFDLPQGRRPPSAESGNCFIENSANQVQ
jgi:hypothetical protein